LILYAASAFPEETWKQLDPNFDYVSAIAGEIPKGGTIWLVQSIISSALGIALVGGFIFG